MSNDHPSQPPPTYLTPSPRPHSPPNNSTRHQARSSTASTGSLTQTITDAPSATTAVLRLRGAHPPTPRSPSTSSRPRIQWAADVIDNEGLNRKKSKVCCIYHRPRPVGESSDESSSDSDSDSDGSGDGSGMEDGARPVGGDRGARGRGQGRHAHGHGHGHDDEGGDCAHDHDHNHEHSSSSGSGKRQARNNRAAEKRQPSPNAYEKMPRYDFKPLTQRPGSS